MIQEKWQLQWLFCYGFAQILHKEGCSTLLLDMNHSARYKFKIMTVILGFFLSQNYQIEKISSTAFWKTTILIIIFLSKGKGKNRRRENHRVFIYLNLSMKFLFSLLTC